MTYEVDSTELFAIPVAKVRLPETDALKQHYLPEMLRRYQAQEYDKPALWETDRVHSSFQVKTRDQVINAMPAVYERLIRQFIQANRFSVQLWHNVYWTGQEYQERHHHIPYHLSLIHFLAFDKAEHKPPIFYDPAELIKAYCARQDIPKEYWSEGAEMDVDEGDVLVFPSYLEHHVPPGEYSKPRVTVSMNVNLYGKG